MDTMAKIFLATLRDRHIDDTHAAYMRCEDAVAQCKSWISGYNKRYKWTTVDSRLGGSLFYASAGDDCPSVEVLEIELL